MIFRKMKGIFLHCVWCREKILMMQNFPRACQNFVVYSHATLFIHNCMLYRRFRDFLPENNMKRALTGKGRERMIFTTQCDTDGQEENKFKNHTCGGVLHVEICMYGNEFCCFISCIIFKGCFGSQICISWPSNSGKAVSNVSLVCTSHCYARSHKAQNDPKLRHISPSFLFSAWDNTSPAGRIFMKFDIKICRETSVFIEV